MNIEINHKINHVYQGVYPSTEAHLISYDNTTSGLTATNVYDALVELYGLFGQRTTIINQPTMQYQKTQLMQMVNNEYKNIRIATTAAQVPCYHPILGTLSNLQTIIDNLAPQPNHLCFTTNVNNQIKFEDSGSIAMSVLPVLEYSINNNINWQSYTIGDTINLSAGEKCYFRGNNAYFSLNNNQYISFVSTANISASGSIMTLLDKTDTLRTVPNYCFAYLFEHCASLITPPELPATTLGIASYSHMFAHCTSLITAPELPVTTLTNNCYNYMFGNCASLITPPELPATTLASACYAYMFINCTSLTTVPELPATTLADSCYQNMFGNCASLTTTGQLPATTLVSNCYYSMFYNCTNLQYINVAFTSWVSGATYNWVKGVSPSGVFKCQSGLTQTFGDNNIPTGWGVDIGYLCFTSEENDNILSLQFQGSPTIPTLLYSTDAKTWNTFNTSTSLNMNQNDKIYIKGTGNTVNNSSSNYVYFGITKRTKCSGNIMSLINFANTITSDYCFASLFTLCRMLTSAPELPSTTLTDYCYYRMFANCWSLITPPELPATTLADYCYCSMFNSCTSLTNAPNLPATTLTPYGYNSMFYNCISLITPPELPATTMADRCYFQMFTYCKLLATVPELPATTMADNCYGSMFEGCTALTEVPELPATTLANSCYYRMFKNCTSLINIPKLSATTLTYYCYNSMFEDCISIKLSTTQDSTYQYAYRIPTSGTGTTGSSALSYMFRDTGGTFTGTPTINTTYYTDHEPV